MPNFLISAVRRAIALPIRLSLLGFRKSDHDALRFRMYRILADEATHIVPRTGMRGLAISGSGVLADVVAPHASVEEIHYPEHSILDLPFPDDTFDLVVTDQVLEHVRGDPFLAVEECRRVLKPGGIAVHATPFLVQIHGYPSDYWRFTPDALALLCENHGEILLRGGWGNRYLWLLSWAGVLFGYKVPLAKWHPYHRIALLNEPDYPVVTWVIARK